MKDCLRIILLLSLVTGCASSTLRPPDYLGDDAGFVVIGIGATKETNYSNYKIYYRNVETKEEDKFHYVKWTDLFDLGTEYSDDNEDGVVEFRVLRPGDYEIYNLWFYGPRVSDYAEYTLQEEISIPFTIAAGETTYLGNYQANGIYGENFVKMKVPVGAYFVVSDRCSNEIRTVKCVKNEINEDVVHKAIPTEQTVPDSIFVFDTPQKRN